MRINHNIAALNTHRQLSQANNANQQSMEKLSSGLRINRAGDDAAGLAISEKMRGQIRGLEQAERNSQDGISMIQTAEGALNETQSILQRMRELTVQAANDTSTSDDREKIQEEINQMTSEINRIGNTTEFNTQKLLNGEAGNKFEITNKSVISNAGVTTGSEGIAGDYDISISGGNAHVLTTNDGSTNGNGAVNYDGTDVTFTSGTDTLDKLDGTSDAAFDGDESVTFEQNGKDATILVEGTDTVQDFIDKANQAFQDKEMDVSATFDSTNGITLTAAKGGSDYDISVTENNFESNASLGFNDVAGMDGAQQSSDYSVNVTGDGAGSTTLSSPEGSVNITNGGETFNMDLEISGVGSSSVSLETNELNFQIGANENQSMTLKVGDMRANSLGITGSGDGFTSNAGVTDGTSSSLTQSGLDVSTHTNAANATTLIDDAIKDVSEERAKLGATQNRLEHTINNLGTSSENLTAAESRIRDVDYASAA